MIVITGVTGRLGRIVAEDLLAKVPAEGLAVVARTPHKAQAFADRGVEVRHGDYDDESTLEAAFADAQTLLFVSSSEVTPGVRPRQHRAVVDAARKAGVGRIVYTSAITADDGQSFLADHTVTEAAIRESGLPYTFLRNTFYTEQLVDAGLTNAVDAGELTAPAIGHPLVTASIEDLALAAVAVLTGEGHSNAVYELRGPGWTYEELAQSLTVATGKTVRHREVDDSELGDLAFIVPLLRQAEFGTVTADLEKLLGRPATGLDEAVRAALAR